MNEIVHAVEQHINPYILPKWRSRLLWLPDDARSMGIHIQAGKGSGKSRLMGRMIAWLDFVRGVPLVIFDPHGPTIDNFLDKLTRLPRELQECLWPRVLYVDMSGHSGHVIPFPLYYRLGKESLYDISQRYLDVVRKIDPYLHTASVEGWNPLWRTGTHVGMILAGLNLQITEAERLLQNHTALTRRFREMLATYPEAGPAVAYIRELVEAKDNIRNRRVDSFLNKIAIFNLDPTMQAMFGSNSPGVNWSRVMSQRQAVLLDFRHEIDMERRQFKMMWAFNYFLDFVKRRGAGRHQPIGLMIDELTSLFSKGTLAAEIFGKEIDELINVIARNYRIWLTIAHQEQFQITGHIYKALMSMGTQILGLTSDWEAALSSAQQFFEYDPYWVKKYEMSSMEVRSVEFTIDEQALLHSYKFTNLRRYQFLVRPARGEGNLDNDLFPVSIARFDEGQYPNEELVEKARSLLMERQGRSVGEALVEIKHRLEHRRKLVEAPMQAIPADSPESDTPPLWTD